MGLAVIAAAPNQQCRSRTDRPTGARRCPDGLGHNRIPFAPVRPPRSCRIAPWAVGSDDKLVTLPQIPGELNTGLSPGGRQHRQVV